MRPSLRSVGSLIVLCGMALSSGCAYVAPASQPGGSSLTAPETGSSQVAATPGSPSPSATISTADLSGRTIVIDPGHTGGWTAKWGTQKVPNGVGGTKPCNSSGTATKGGYAEHAYNFDQAKALAKALRDRGAKVVLTRNDDTTAGTNLCVNHRSDEANQLKADLLISIHADGNTGKVNRGFHLIVSPSMKGGAAVEKQSQEAAIDIRAKLESDTTMPRSNYIGKGTALSARSDLGTLNFATRPALMVEMGNMMNATDADLFGSAQFRTQAAKAMAAGIAAYLA